MSKAKMLRSNIAMHSIKLIDCPRWWRNRTGRHGRHSARCQSGDRDDPNRVHGDDPVKAGLVASLNRPGGNLTGVSVFNTRLGSKRLGLLHEMVPTASPIAILVNPTNPDAEDEAKDIQEAARGLGVQVLVVSASKADDLDAAFSTLVHQGARALIIGADAFFTGQRSQIAIVAARHALPTMWVARIEVAAGGLMSYGANLFDVYRRAGVSAGQVLKGAKPADLPVQLPTAFDLVINLRTAKALGLEVPPTLLARADEVIEWVRQPQAGAIQPVKVRPK
jgi:putative tryptophan/tyrosine transport system substrate-binding protein